MTLRGVVVALFFTIAASALTLAEAPKAVSVPAGDLADGLESLAKQYGMDVIYSSVLVKGRKTDGVNGTFPSVEAFRKLLEGNDLVFSEDSGSVLIMQAEIAPLLATMPPTDDPIDEVEVEGQRVKLSVMRAELEKLEERFYAEYNKVNTVRQYERHRLSNAQADAGLPEEHGGDRRPAPGAVRAGQGVQRAGAAHSASAQ